MIGLSAAAKVVSLGGSLKAWAYVVAGAILLGLAIFGAGYGYGNGHGEATATWEAASKAEKIAATVAADKLEAQKALANANAKYRQQESDHEKEVAQLRLDFAKDQAVQHATDTAAVAALLNGTHRLRLQVASCQAGSAQAQSAPGGVDEAGTAELAPTTSAALYGIAADGDDAIRTLTKLQEWATSAVKLCSGDTK